MRLLAESAGYVLLEDQSKLHFATRATNAGAVAVFVLALVTSILGINGVVQLVLWHAGHGSAIAAAVLLGVAAVSALCLWRARRWLRVCRARPVEGLGRIATVDFECQALLDPTGRVLAPLSEVRFQLVMQMASSSRALAACWNGGQIVVARGSPFAGSVALIREALRQRGLRA
jgi:hypothetical protein